MSLQKTSSREGEDDRDWGESGMSSKSMIVAVIYG